MPEISYKLSRSTLNGRVVAFRGCWNMEALAEAFSHLGYDVWIDPTSEQLRELKPGELVVCLTNIHLDIKVPLHSLRIKKLVNCLGAPFVFWDRDGPSHMGEKSWRIWLLKHFTFMDAYATHTLQDAGRFSDEVIYLPNASWRGQYNLNDVTLEAMRDRSRYKYDVSFFGRIDALKFPEAALRAEFLKKLGLALDRLNVRYYFGGHDIDICQQVELIQHSIINLSLYAGCDVRYQGGYHGEPFSWGLPERCFGIPSCGGFLLSDERAHAEDEFVSGKEWVSFSDSDDCVSKILFYLENFDMARNIAEAAYAKILSCHTYEHRATKLLRFCLYWKQKKGLVPVPRGM